MEVSLSDDQTFFSETTHRFLGTESPLSTIRSLTDDPDGFDRGWWQKGCELGWTSLLVPEEAGGGSISGAGVVDATIVADAFGHHVAPGPLLPCNIVAAALARAGTDAHRDEVVPALVAGETVAAWAGAELAHAGPGPQAVADGDGLVVDGVATTVEAGAQADLVLVTAMSPAGPVQALLANDAPGMTITPLESIDVTRRYARITFDGVRVGADDRVGTDDSGVADLDRQLQLALVLQVAEMAGAAQRTFDFTLEWAFDRYSFGRPIASYQELKHRYADMKMWLEATHGLVTALAREVDAGAPSATETASIAKAYAGHYLALLAHDCIQMHGGIGLTVEHDIHLFVRRITADRATYGTPPVHRHRVGVIAGAA